ncbi:MAG: DUF6529 family protein [Candidatus Limnocylindrales bacterium]
MTTPTTPAVDAPRRTRVPDWLTDAVMLVTVVFSVWAVVLIVLTIAEITKPASIYSDPKIQIKSLGSTVVVILALSQFYTMHAVMGHLPRGSFKVKTLMKAHRYGGRTTIALAAVIAFFCIVDVGAKTDPLRVGIHAIRVRVGEGCRLRWTIHETHDDGEQRQQHRCQ